VPAPQAAALKQIAKMAFKAHAIQLPVNWQQPQGDAGKQYVDAHQPSERAVAPDPSKLFIPATPNKYHVDTVKMVSNQFESFIDGICDAIASAWSQWQASATLAGVVIAGPVASGGTVAGPPWTPLIMASAPKASPAELKYSKAVATVLGSAWQAYTASIKVAGMPWYPPLAAFPSPASAPTPNVPNPVTTLVQVPAPMQAPLLKNQMIGALADPQAPHHRELFDAISQAVAQCFTLWMSTTMVSNVIGAGPVPTFAPPFAPAGPVVAGVGNMAPGGFA
jgi:hypothetical protein